MTRTDLSGCPVDVVDREALLDALLDAARRGRFHHHVSLNAAKWVAMRRDPLLRRVVREAATVVGDGASIVRAAGLPERLPGIEVAEALLDAAAREGLPVALLGAAPEVLRAVDARLRARGVRVVSARDGTFTEDAERAVAEAIGASGARIVLLALGTPKAEHFVGRWGPLLGGAVVMGVGGSFDVWAGRARRAPAWVGRAGLEWAWRFAGAPRARFRRAIVDSVRFVVLRRSHARVP